MGRPMVAPTNYSEQMFGTAFWCFPLRVGCYLLCVLCSLDCLYALYGLVSEDTRLLVGGFSEPGRVVGGALGFVGLFCAFYGVLGLHENSPLWVRNFWYYMIAHAVCIFGLYISDIYLLKDCEDTKKMLSDPSSHAVQAISMAHECGSAQTRYTLYFLIDLLLSTYGIALLGRFIGITESSPTYLIHLDETRPLITYRTPISVRTQPMQAASPAVLVTPGLIQASQFQWPAVPDSLGPPATLGVSMAVPAALAPSRGAPQEDGAVWLGKVSYPGLVDRGGNALQM